MGVVNDCNRSRLLRNPNVQSLTTSHVVYTSEFKKLALRDYQLGVPGRLIWLNAGFDLTDFVSGYFRKALKRWEEQSCNSQANSDWTKDSRGLKESKEFSSEKEELEYLRAENYFLKELHALGMDIKNR